MSLSNAIKLILLSLIFSLIPVSAQAQAHYCYHRIHDIEWSPDGQLLGIMTSQGALIYDHDLNLVNSIEAPDLSRSNHYWYRRMLWSPDGEWLILPELYDYDFAQNVGGYNGWLIASVQTGEFRPMESFSFLRELAWSPDNRFILALRYDSGIGLSPSFSEIVLFNGISDERIESVSRRFEEIEFDSIRWENENTISVQYDNITIYLDTNLELLDRAPTIEPRRMIPNETGTLEAGMTTEIYFVVREMGEEEQIIDIEPLLNANGEFVTIGHIGEIVWWTDDEHLTGIYSYNQHVSDENPSLSRFLQGIVVNAGSASLESGFLFEADGDISGYSVSTRGDRIALYHDETWLELWNPLTGERLANISIPDFPISETC